MKAYTTHQARTSIHDQALVGEKLADALSRRQHSKHTTLGGVLQSSCRIGYQQPLRTPAQRSAIQVCSAARASTSRFCLLSVVLKAISPRSVLYRTPLSSSLSKSTISGVVDTRDSMSLQAEALIHVTNQLTRFHRTFRKRQYRAL